MSKIAKPSAAGSSTSEADAVPSESQEARTKVTKIQIGSYATSSARKQGATESTANSSQDASATSSAAAVAKSAASITSSTTLFDLCDRSYSLKHTKRGKKRKDVTAEEKAATDARGKASAIEANKTTYLGSSRSSSSAKAKDQCGMGPRVEIVNGKIIVRESSLMVSQESNFADGEYEEVVEGNHATATYSSFLKSRHAYSWGIEETRLFYQCLRQCGTEFSIMQSFFPGRTRKQLRAKFFREEKQHPELVKIAMSTSLPLGEHSGDSAASSSSSAKASAAEKKKKATTASAADSSLPVEPDSTHGPALSEMISDDEEDLYDV